MTTPPFRYNIAILGIDTLCVKRRRSDGQRQPPPNPPPHGGDKANFGSSDGFYHSCSSGSHAAGCLDGTELPMAYRGIAAGWWGPESGDEFCHLYSRWFRGPVAGAAGAPDAGLL